ncbi:MAG: 23S rRNA (adenine(2503)-C(2))-methyltransferase RlmN [Candidatus Abawacabacteria bacterium]|nr:23S rRNA (adenine(2503)-C(2))-methyltransferase RlmN [Candidatus Abawacabacteria bacterium]
MFVPDQLKEWLITKGQPAYRYQQIMQAIFKEGKQSFAEILTLPKALRTDLENTFSLTTMVRKLVSRSKDNNCTKILFACADGQMVEAVLMEFEDGRYSACISSQVGCALKCSFCATGDFGFKRNLSSLEILEQVWSLQSELTKEGKRISNLVFMGMGEPLLNYDAVIEAVKMINNPDLIGLGMRHITISTSGIAPCIYDLAKDLPQVNLAISLHAPDQTIRAQIMPIAKKYDLKELFAAVDHHIEQTHRRVTYEYLLIDGLNDTEELAHILGKKIKNQLCHVNLIPWNQTTHPTFKPSTRSAIFKFAHILEDYGVPVTIRVTIGSDIDAACGQLANRSQEQISV